MNVLYRTESCSLQDQQQGDGASVKTHHHATQGRLVCRHDIVSSSVLALDGFINNELCNTVEILDLIFEAIW